MASTAGRALVDILGKVVNSLTCEVIHNRFEDSESNRQIPSHIQEDWLDSFSGGDQIYQEFDGTNTEMQHVLYESDNEQPLIPKLNTWRDLRPKFIKTASTALRYGLAITGYAVLIGVVAAVAIYISWLTNHFCGKYPLNKISTREIWVTKGIEVVRVVFVHSWFTINLGLAFGWNFLKQSRAILVAGGFCLSDVVYRIILLLCRIDKTIRLRFYLLVLPIFSLVFSTFIQSYCITGTRARMKLKEKFVLSTKMWLSPIASIAIINCSYFAFYPWYDNTESSWGKLFIACFSPLIGSVLKSFLRIAMQRLKYVNHPGTSFILMNSPYFVSALMARILQAELKSIDFIILLGIIHGIVEVLERSSMVLRDHLDNQVVEGRWMPLGAFRTPRSERLTADLALMSIIFETASIVISNSCVGMYSVIYLDKPMQISIVYVTAAQVGIEWVFTSISLAIETHFQNIPVLRVWRKRKWQHLVSAMVIVVLFSFSFAAFFRDIVNSIAGDLDCAYQHPNATAQPLH